MANTGSFAKRWETFRPTKGVWLWSCVGCVVATIVIGFTYGGWVMGTTAERMANDAAGVARAQLAAAACVALFNQGPDAISQLAELKNASSHQRSDMIVKGGWATVPGSIEPVRGAAEICVEKLMGAVTTAASG